MPDEVSVDPAELGRAAQIALTESKILFDGLATDRDQLLLSSDDFGLPKDNTALVIGASVAIERFVTVMEEEAEGLYGAAFMLQAADDLSAEEFAMPSGPNIAV